MAAGIGSAPREGAPLVVTGSRKVAGAPGGSKEGQRVGRSAPADDRPSASPEGVDSFGTSASFTILQPWGVPWSTAWRCRSSRLEPWNG